MFAYTKTKGQIIFEVIALLIVDFHLMYSSTITLLVKSENFNPLAFFFACTALFVLDLVYCQLRISVSICQNQRQPQDVSTSDFKDYENPL